jgi:hypothetical protein
LVPLQRSRRSFIELRREANSGKGGLLKLLLSKGGLLKLLLSKGGLLKLLLSTLMVVCDGAAEGLGAVAGGRLLAVGAGVVSKIPSACLPHSDCFHPSSSSHSALEGREGTAPNWK